MDHENVYAHRRQQLRGSGIGPYQEVSRWRRRFWVAAVYAAAVTLALVLALRARG